jgi:hypothetical protein
MREEHHQEDDTMLHAVHYPRELIAEVSYSPLQALKAPPGLPSPRALLRLIAKPDQIRATQGLTLDLAWLHPNLQKALAQHVWQTIAHRLRGLPAPQHYTVLVCFLTQTSRKTIDQLVDRYSKVVTATYRRAQYNLDTMAKRHHTMLRATIQSFHTLGHTLVDDAVAPDAVRTTVLQHIPIAALDTTQVWGDGRASSSDGQRFLFPRRVLRRTSILAHMRFVHLLHVVQLSVRRFRDAGVANLVWFDLVTAWATMLWGSICSLRTTTPRSIPCRSSVRSGMPPTSSLACSIMSRLWTPQSPILIPMVRWS